MANNTWNVSGRQFRTEADYQAALKDAAVIEQLKKRYDTDRPEQRRELMERIGNGTYRFRTILGKDFLEELEELEELDKKPAVAGTKTKGTSRMQKISGDRSGTHATRKKPRTELETGFRRPSGAKSNDETDSELEANARKVLRARELRRKILASCCILIAIGSFAYLGIYTLQGKRLDNYVATQKELKGQRPIADVTPETVVIHYDNQEIIVPDILDEYKTLYSLNKKLIGWIKVDDTYIDYPVLQTVDNTYYLKHNFDQEEDKNGSIFLDTSCSILPRSDNLIIYGHHMHTGRMFGQLDKYSSEDFYKKHRYITFDTIYEKGTYEVMYVFRSKIYEETSVVFKYYQFIDANSETEFNSYMREMAEMSLYDTGVTAEYGDELLTLSTCDYYTDNGRFVVVAKKVK